MNLERVTDAIYNTVTGVGTSRDKATYNFYSDDPPLDCGELEALYAHSDIAAVIVDQVF